jgi:hypothetical protein
MRYTQKCAYSRVARLLRKPKRALGPFGNPDRGLSPLDASVVCMRFVHAHTHLSLLTTS